MKTQPIDWTKPIQTVGGSPARVICTDRKSNLGRNFVVAILGRDGSENIRSFFPDGGGGCVGLENVPEALRVLTVEKTMWANLYEDSEPALHNCREEADTQASIGRFACVEVNLKFNNIPKGFGLR